MARRHREILDALLRQIVDGKYAPGVMLPKEELIREEFEVSRGTGREALRALEERRVAVVKHGRGATVQPPEAWNVLDPAVAAALSQGRKRRAFLGEVAECRAVLRGEAAGMAAERASSRERTAIGDAIGALPQTGDPGAAAQELWRLVAVASGNRPLAATLTTLAEIDDAPFRKDALDAYAALGAAIAAADPDAARDAARRTA